MSDSSPPPASSEEIEYELARLRIQASTRYIGRMIWLITGVAGMMALVIVATCVLLAFGRIFGGGQISAMLAAKPIPDVLSNWGGVILGFYFGQFINLVKGFMGAVSRSNVLLGRSQI